MARRAVRSLLYLLVTTPLLVLVSIGTGPPLSTHTTHRRTVDLDSVPLLGIGCGAGGSQHCRPLAGTAADDHIPPRHSAEGDCDWLRRWPSEGKDLRHGKHDLFEIKCLAGYCGHVVPNLFFPSLLAPV